MKLGPKSALTDDSQQTTPGAPTDPQLGSFGYIESKIRRESRNTTELGHAFAQLCVWYLENAPIYRGKFDRIWLWQDWPDRWGPDCGIDIVAKTRNGDLWAVQAKAIDPSRAVSKREIDSFLSESNRPQIKFRLLIATTDNIGKYARPAIDQQEKPVGHILRWQLLTSELQWPSKVGGVSKSLPKRGPRPHQKHAIDSVLKGFKKNKRGRLVMACGTGKTLTAMWIAEKLRSNLTLILVPSLSLVGQNLREWGRSARQDFDALVVCSDQSITQKGEDASVQSTSELAVDPTTEPLEIRKFLNTRRTRPAVVFATYQSSAQISAAQNRKSKPFDLVICDEAHRLVGNRDGMFATVLDEKKIKASKRLFMTATPRYFKDSAKRAASDLGLELASMDDIAVFGPEFHELSFHEAINSDPPLLTDYQVVVVGVTDREAKKWAEEGKFIRTQSGVETDARSLATKIGLAKAIRKYGLQRIITFHSSVAKARSFADDTQLDSFPSIVQSSAKSLRPTGELWTRHISGMTPAGQRASVLKELSLLPRNAVGIVSNCACLGEGVDVPVLDAVAFIDPRRSMVDIIQAVGRAIRLSEGKKIGTVVIPVFIDQTQDAEEALSQSAFEPVWQVLKALRAHDKRLADELDQIRLRFNKGSGGKGRVKLPNNIHFDIPSILPREFDKHFFARLVQTTTSKPNLTVQQILEWADAHKSRTDKWPSKESGNIHETDENWRAINQALLRGNRGLTLRCSLVKLLERERGRPNPNVRPSLTTIQILRWADEHRRQKGEWPKQGTGKVANERETWLGIDAALRHGKRGLPGGSSLAQLLQDQRGVPNHLNRPILTEKQILSWADKHKRSTGEWPKEKLGPIDGTDETWERVNAALKAGTRGLPGGSSLARLLKEKRGVVNVHDRSRLTYKQILTWADQHKEKFGDWPTEKSGPIDGTDETWAIVNGALKAGTRGLPGSSSLARLLEQGRGRRNSANVAALTIDQILVWADDYQSRRGQWPNKASGSISGTGETWQRIDSALKQGLRELPGGSSLYQLFKQQRGLFKRRGHRAKLEIDQVLEWAEAHKKRKGKWPSVGAGEVSGTSETWSAIDKSLRVGNRGLPGGSSLAQLLEERCGARNHLNAAQLSINQILSWARAHRRLNGKWPSSGSGIIEGTNENWNAINTALWNGNRGLPSGMSLAQLLPDH
jgi:superfamily II DNA or RNA helicase